MKNEETTELRMLRKKLGIKMIEAARLAGTPYRSWQDWETGHRPTPGLALAWAKLYADLQKIKEQK